MDPTIQDLMRLLYGPLELRTMCRPDEFVPGEHLHQCKCGTTWRHANILPELVNEAEFHIAHECPACGTKVTNKYFH